MTVTVNYYTGVTNVLVERSGLGVSAIEILRERSCGVRGVDEIEAAERGEIGWESGCGPMGSDFVDYESVDLRKSARKGGCVH